MENKFLYKFEVKSGDTSRVFGIAKPSRRLKEDGEIMFAAQTSKFVKAGILPKAAWSTLLSNGGGSISDQDRELYGNLLISLRDKSFELQKILVIREGSTGLDKEAEKKIDELTIELNDIKNDLQAFENTQASIFENTAEAKARNKTIMWWVCKISKEITPDSVEDILKGADYDEKLDYYDSLEDEEDKNKDILFVLRRMTYLITLWFLGRISTEDDFKLYDKEFSKSEEGPSSEADVKPEIKSEDKAPELSVVTDSKLPESELIEEIKL
jgi:hypothetical protein